MSLSHARRGRFLLVTLSWLAAACHEPDKFVLSPTDVRSMLDLAPTVLSLPADGVSRTTIVATIAPNASNDARTIEFKTTLGTIVGSSADGGKTATVVADSAGHATMVLVADAQPGDALITASIKRGADVLLSQTLSFRFDPPAADNYFSVSLDRSAVPADGSSEALITVEARLTATQGRKTFDFWTSDGVFVTSGGATAPEVKGVAADDRGVVSMKLRSSARPGAQTIRVTLPALNIVREIPITFSTVRTSDVISVSVANPTPPADGLTVTRVSATLAPGGVDRVVTFGVSGGLTITSQAVASPDGVAVAFLTSPERVQVAEITATVANAFTARTSVSFQRALPESIIVMPTSNVIDPGFSSPLRVDVKLLRSIGQVTNDTVVSFTALLASGQQVFSATTVSSNGAASANVTVPPGTASGPLQIRVTVPGSGVVGTATVQIQ